MLHLTLEDVTKCQFHNFTFRSLETFKAFSDEVIDFANRNPSTKES